jgi:hypothetical protein
MAGLTQNYHETIDPAVMADETAITLATTYKALIPTARYNLGSQFFNKVGRKLRIRAFGKITTAATPGNGQIGILFGTNADANGVNVVQSAAVALIASQTNISWECEVYIPAVIATTASPMYLPASAAVVSASVDLTGVLVPSLQFLRSGSTAETMTVQDYDISPLN